LYFFPQEKTKPAARQGRKITGLTEDSRIALKKVVWPFFSESKIKPTQKSTAGKNLKGGI
jgi:preprotein translocase subunit SecE